MYHLGVIGSANIMRAAIMAARLCGSGNAKWHRTLMKAKSAFSLSSLFIITAISMLSACTKNMTNYDEYACQYHGTHCEDESTDSAWFWGKSDESSSDWFWGKTSSSENSNSSVYGDTGGFYGNKE